MKFMSVERVNIIEGTIISTTAWTELDIDTLSKSESVKLAKLLATNDVIVADDKSAPCHQQVMSLAFGYLLMK